MLKEEKDLYTIRIDNLTIRGGINPKNNKPSIILGMPAADEKGYYSTLKIDGEEKLAAIVKCISVVIESKEKDDKCEFYPKPDNGCICYAGSNISSKFICTKEFSKSCIYANEQRKLWKGGK